MSGIMLNVVGGSFAPPAPTVIGQAFGGGYYAGQISTAGTGVANFYLVVGPVASAQSTLTWKNALTNSAGTTSLIEGNANSAAMNDASHPAAFFCEGLTIGGFSDWYMPAKNELEVCYYNLKPTTAANNTGGTFGQNANSVPTRTSNYTAVTPPQTSATIFQTGNAEAFVAVIYWSSTQFSNGRSWFQYFSNGAQYNGYKNLSYRVRAVRRVAV
jgi:hypothetical protein